MVRKFLIDVVGFSGFKDHGQGNMKLIVVDGAIKITDSGTGVNADEAFSGCQILVAVIDQLLDLFVA